MLRGERIGLRARIETDIPVLMKELYGDVATRSRADSRPWVPIPSDAEQTPYHVDDSAGAACFSVVELEGDKLVGDALLWGIDLHNRLAHIGLSIRPVCRGRGYAGDIVSVLCGYGFSTRGLHRLQIDTLADNVAMRRAAESAGFTHEATLRRSAWVSGSFVDEVAYGLLADEWALPPK